MSKAVNRKRKIQIRIIYACMIVGLLLLTWLIVRAVSLKRASTPGVAEADTEIIGEVSGQEAISAPETERAETDAKEQTADRTDYEPITSEKKLRSFGSVVLVGNRAYELYNYRDTEAGKYAKALNRVAKTLDGEAQVYSIVAPLGSGICFPDNLTDQIHVSDQQKAIADIYGQERKSIHKVFLYDIMMQHRTEDIYFRTDHHWTALGAYYAYVGFCGEKGLTPNPLDGYETVTYDGFLGSFYQDTKAKILKKHPDTLVAYLPLSDTELKVTDSDGKKFEWQMISDVTSYSAGLKYSTFAAGDNPVTVITNTSTDSKESCIVVKDSYGNAMIPFLSDHYKRIYEIDFRYWSGDIATLAKKHGVDDVIFINNLSMTRNKYLVAQLKGIIN